MVSRVDGAATPGVLQKSPTLQRRANCRRCATLRLATVPFPPAAFSRKKGSKTHPDRRNCRSAAARQAVALLNPKRWIMNVAVNQRSTSRALLSRQGWLCAVLAGALFAGVAPTQAQNSG